MGAARPPDDLPPDVPRSASGRVPQWVLDEAAGKPAGPVPFRFAQPSTFLDAPPRRRRRRPGFAVVATVTVVAIVVGGVAWGLSRPTPNIAAGRDPGAVTAPAEPSSTAVPRIPGYPPPGLEEGARPATASRAVPSEGTAAGFRFSGHQPDRTSPVAWSPCRPIHYVVRSAHQPKGGAALIAAAVATVSEATGLTFVDDGATTEGPVEDRPYYQLSRYGDRWAPVLITWATADEVPDLGIDVIGEARRAQFTTPSGDDTYVTGEIDLDAAAMARLMTRPKGVQAAGAVVLHELGHLVGLAHVNDTAQVMYPSLRSQQVTLGDGDERGLAALGTGACQPDI
jgi:hypothetical protein